MKKVLSLVLAMMMVMSVMVFPSFAAEGHALNDLQAYGQGKITAAYLDSNPVNQAWTDLSEYKLATPLRAELFGVHTTVYYANVFTYVAHTKDEIVIAHELPELASSCTEPGSGSWGNSSVAYVISFPDTFTTSDTNENILAIKSGATWNYGQGEEITIVAQGSDEFKAKLAAYGTTGTEYVASGLVTGVNWNNGYLGNTAWGSTDGGGCLTNTRSELSLSKAALMDIFGWDGETDMTIMTGATYGMGYSLDWSFYNATLRAEALTQLNTYSAANGDAATGNDLTALGVYQAANAVNVIPDVVSFEPVPAPASNALNDLAAFGQQQITAPFVFFDPPTVNGSYGKDPYSHTGKDEDTIYTAFLEKSYWPGCPQGNEKVFVAHDLDWIYFNVAHPYNAGGNNITHVIINFPTKWTAADVGNALVITIDDADRGYDSITLNLIGSAEFKAALADKVAALGSGADLINNGFILGAAGMGAVLTGGQSMNPGYTLDDSGKIVGTVSTCVRTTEFAVSKEGLMDLFGWDGKTAMTIFSAGYAIGGQNVTTCANQTTLGVEALLNYSAANGDNTAAITLAELATLGLAGDFASVTVDNAIPDIVNFAPVSGGAALDELGRPSATATNKTPTIDGILSDGEYSDSFTFKPHNLGDFTVNVAHDLEWIYFGSTWEEPAKTQGGNGFAWSRNYHEIVINFPKDGTVSDVNNAIIFHIRATWAGQTNEGQTASYRVIGSDEFVAKITAALAKYGTENGDLFNNGLIKGNAWSNTDGGMTGFAEYAINKAALKEAFGWDGESYMTFLFTCGFGNYWSTAMDAFKDAAALNKLLAYSAANGDNTPTTDLSASGCEQAAAMTGVVPFIVNFDAVESKMLDAGSIKINSEVVGLRFKHFWTKNFLESLGSYEVGTLIAPLAYVEEAGGVMTHAALEALGKETPYIEVSAAKALDYDAKNGIYTFAGSIVDIKDVTRDYAAVGYVKVGDTYYYAGEYTVRSVSEIANAALLDTRAAKDEANGYIYEIEPGVWSCYSKTQISRIAALAA